MDDRREPDGILVDRCTYGNVEATVWAQQVGNGELFLEIKLCRVEELPNGRRRKKFSFYPQDLKDVADLAIRTRFWAHRANSFLLPRLEKRPGSVNGTRPAK